MSHFAVAFAFIRNLSHGWPCNSSSRTNLHSRETLANYRCVIPIVLVKTFTDRLRTVSIHSFSLFARVVTRSINGNPSPVFAILP